ncbi:MAG: hypothetical protein RJA52_772 [Bacteroidota bacterium]|jgi:hypothetical protein
MKDWYLDAACGSKNWNCLIYYFAQNPIAVFPYWIRKKNGFQWIDMPPLVKYMGPIIHPNYRNSDWTKRIWDDFARRIPKYFLFRQNFNPSILDWLPFFHQGFSQTTAYSFYLKKTNKSDLWNNLHRNIKRNIQKAEKAKIIVVHEDKPDILLNLQENSFQRQNIKVPYSEPIFYQIDRELKTRKKRYILFAQKDSGEKIAGAYLLHDGNVCYYHISGENSQYRSLGSGILLLWEAINFAFDKLNVEVFDFEGSMIKGVESIRRQFGANPYPYFKIQKVKYSWMKIILS